MVSAKGNPDPLSFKTISKGVDKNNLMDIMHGLAKNV